MCFFQMLLEQVMVAVNSDVHNNSTSSDNNRLGKAIVFQEVFVPLSQPAKFHTGPYVAFKKNSWP